jgi:cytochrome c oxidase subunit III
MDLNVGTLEPAEREPYVRTRRSRSSTTSGRSSGDSGGGKNGGGGDNNDGGPGGSRFDEQQSHEPGDKSRILTIFLLIVVLMTFGGLMGAYVFVSTNRALEWRPFDLPLQVWFSTLIILASSVTYEFGQKAIARSDVPGTRKWLVVTTCLGAVFIASQLLVWLILVNRGLYMSGNPYAGFFYLLTAVHAVHVIGGIIALGAVLLRSWQQYRTEQEHSYRTALSRSVGWYWHFMGVLWIVLFTLLGFWK